MLPPLQFDPIYMECVWGPPVTLSRLQRVFGREIPRGHQRVGESWELADLAPNWVTRVRTPGLLQYSLHDLVGQHWREIAGPRGLEERFPILIKYLDIEDRLSVQVHPDDDLARRLGCGSSGKHEIWVILAAEPGARLWAGFREKISEQELRKVLAEGRLPELLWDQSPLPGQAYYFPPGTVHAAGGGLFVAEIQQTSSVTFRLFDWHRQGPDGASRQLHVEEALQAIRFDQGPVRPIEPKSAEGNSQAERLVACEKFEVARWRLERRHELEVGSSFKILAVLEGSLRLWAKGQSLCLASGEVVLLPWSLSTLEVEPACDQPVCFLEVCPPPV